MAYNSIIGRGEEIKNLERVLKSSKSEFVAIYGRRRVGKSFLVEEVYRDKIAFRAVGAYIKEKDEKTYKQIQLDHFYEGLLDCGMPDDTIRPTCWREAFRLLRKFLEGLRTKRKVIFLDELPWLAGPQSSEMITELGYFWNSWADRQRNIVLVVCGSATSWMLDNVIRDSQSKSCKFFFIIDFEYRNARAPITRFDDCGEPPVISLDVIDRLRTVQSD